MLSKLFLLSLCFFTMTSAQDGGSGQEEVSGADVIGQALLSAKILADGFERLSLNFKGKICQELELQTKSINGNYEMVSDSERKFIEDARVSASQTALGMKSTRKTLVELANDVTSRLRPIRMMTGKSLSSASNLRMQQAGIRLVVTKMSQLMKSQLAMMEDAMKQQNEAAVDLGETLILLTNFTNVLTDMADKEGQRYKVMYQKWKDLYIESIFTSKLMGYWNYVTPTLDSMTQLVDKANTVRSGVDDQSEALAKVKHNISEAITELGATYKMYKDSSDTANMIDVDDFNSKYSLFPYEHLLHQVEQLANL